MLYNELMNAALEPTHKITINQYLEQNSTILSIHLLEDLQLLKTHQGYWTLQGDLELETYLKENQDGLQRLQENYTGITTYLIEMSRWWSKTRQTPPCLSHLYHGPDNSIFLSALVGYQTLGQKKNRICSEWVY